MPGPVSDSFDPEFGTGENAAAIREALQGVYLKLTRDVLNNQPPLYILDLVRADLPQRIQTSLTEKEWRLIRFALERAQESL